MIILHRQFMFKWVGNCRLIFLAFLLISNQGIAQSTEKNRLSTASQNEEIQNKDWSYFEKANQKALEMDRVNGMSYIISGSIALLGGIAGSSVTSDPLEKGIYALFQTIGVASVGYGAYKWRVGDEERLLVKSLNSTPELNDFQRLAFIKVYFGEQKDLNKEERMIKTVTHTLIALLNFYNASQQQAGGVKNSLYFIGGANLLAALSYTF